MRISKLLGGNRPPTAIINGTSSGGIIQGSINPNGAAKSILSGAMTANVMVEAISVTGQGIINIAAVAQQADATARTHRLKITIDGVVVFDATSSPASGSQQGICAIGHATGGSLVFDQVYFNSGFRIEFASSISETAKQTVYVTYKLF
jgi:hypothetical protein